MKKYVNLQNLNEYFTTQISLSCKTDALSVTGVGQMPNYFVSVQLHREQTTIVRPTNHTIHFHKISLTGVL